MDQLKKGLIAAVAAGTALATGQAAAELYVGASVGGSTFEGSYACESKGYDGFYPPSYPSNECFSDNDATSLEFEADDTALKVFGGYLFNEYVGVEVGFLDLGDLSDDVSSQYDGGEFGYSGTEKYDAETQITGYTVQLLGQYPIGTVDLFAKVGFMDWNANSQVNYTDAWTYNPNDSTGVDTDRDDYDTTGNDWIYGVGATYNFGDFGVRAEWEMIDVKIDTIDELSVWSIGLEYRVK